MQEDTSKQLNKTSDYHERQIQKKAAREGEALKARRIGFLKRSVYWIVGLVIVIGSGWLLISVAGPKGQDYSQAYPILGRNHISDGSTVSYNSNPPTSGDHYVTPAPARFYDKELSDEQLVHNLEHGQIWIAYKSGLPETVVKTLKKLSGGNVAVTPRSKNDTDIAIVAWGRLDKFNLEGGTFDAQRIKDFISRYQNQGPENPSGFSGHLR
ncbi:MAG: DUF3105 domain-containing protein [Candidatus Yanofskybacteria bacterium]|nr:DUF3105 domain-containing protein [Candidatus Yanofskybacteria bacterium]